MKFIVYIILFLLNLHAEAQDTTSGKTYRLGDERIQVINSCFIPCKSGVLFINVHENEITSVKAAEELLRGTGGTLMKLKHSGERNISFYLGNKRFFFDPNRIYTRKGINATLKNLGPYSKEAGDKVEEFGKYILAQYVEGKTLVVALHNNTNENYSIKNYQAGGSEAMNAAQLYINPGMDEDDFIVTTEVKIFDFIKSKNMNVVLQDNKRAIDDGSLSVYAAKNNIPYINVEAEHGHNKEQVALLEALKDVIKEYAKED